MSKRRPRFLIWLLTARCNLSCKHCYTVRLVKKGELSFEEIKNILLDASQVGVRHINFTGGEIFVRNDALDIISHTSSLGIRTSIVTNGLLLDEEVVKGLARSKVFVFFSLDGADKEIHERIRGKGTWEKANQGIERLKEAGVPFCFVMAINRINSFQMREYLYFAKRKGALAVCLIPVLPVGKAKEEMLLSPEEIEVFLEEVSRTAEEMHFPVSLWCLPFAGLKVKSQLVSAGSCRGGEGMDIDPSGDVLLCDVLDITLSNVKKGLLEAYREQEESPLLKSLIQPQLKEPCLSCPLRKECRGGCFARSYLLKGDIHTPDPLCPRVSGKLKGF